MHEAVAKLKGVTFFFFGQILTHMSDLTIWDKLIINLMLILLQILEMLDHDDKIGENSAVEQKYYDFIGNDMYVFYLMLTIPTN